MLSIRLQFLLVFTSLDNRLGFYSIYNNMFMSEHTTCHPAFRHIVLYNSSFSCGPVYGVGMCLYSKFPGVKSKPLGVHMWTGSHMYTKKCWFNTGKFTLLCWHVKVSQINSSVHHLWWICLWCVFKTSLTSCLSVGLFSKLQTLDWISL